MRLNEEINISLQEDRLPNYNDKLLESEIEMQFTGKEFKLSYSCDFGDDIELFDKTNKLENNWNQKYQFKEHHDNAV